jgi:hypothetical protein
MTKKSINKYCYISGEKLFGDNISKEHIIPNALGGFLKCSNLVTEKINNTLFAKLDAELAKAIELSRLISFKRDRGEQPGLIGISEEGMRYLVKNSVFTILPMKPIEFIDSNGKPNKRIPESQIDEYYKSLAKKYPNLSKEDFLKKVTFVTENKKKNIDFKNGLNIITNEIHFRGIAKIATNFAIKNNISRTCFLEMINFIKGADNYEKIELGYFYPKSFLKYHFYQNEISHILYLKGCNTEKILYCYIELFNTHCFIVILDKNYNGQNINESYVWDLLKRKQLNKSISLNVNRNFLLNREYMFYNGVEEDYGKRLKRTSRICSLKIKFPQKNKNTSIV